MIVKKTKQLGNFKRGINLYIPKKRISTAAPTTLPLSTPNLYFSGLTFNIPYSQSGNTFVIYPDYFSQAYARISNTLWRVTFSPSYDYLQYNAAGPFWLLTVKCAIDDTYDSFDGGYIIARNYASATEIPLTGWINDDIVQSGTLVIRTTP